MDIEVWSQAMNSYTINYDDELNVPVITATEMSYKKEEDKSNATDNHLECLKDWMVHQK